MFYEFGFVYVCAFNLLFLFLLCFCLFLRIKRKKGMELCAWEDGEDLVGVWKGETVQNILYENLFSTKPSNILLLCPY